MAQPIGPLSRRPPTSPPSPPRMPASRPISRRGSTSSSPTSAPGACTGSSSCATGGWCWSVFEAEDNARRPRSGQGRVQAGHAARHALGVEERRRPALRHRARPGQGARAGTPLYAAFPEYADLAASAGRDRLTLHHVLTMTMGTDWDESSIPYSDPANSEIAMDLAPDRYRYILERRVVMEPGKRWTYCGGATALLARLIAKGTGKPLHTFAREALFDPLGHGPHGMAGRCQGRPLRRIGPAHGAPRPRPHRHDDGERRHGRRPARRAGTMARALHGTDRRRR